MEFTQFTRLVTVFLTVAVYHQSVGNCCLVLGGGVNHIAAVHRLGAVCYVIPGVYMTVRCVCKTVKSLAISKAI